MAFKEGHKKKGGRQKGTLNKDKGSLRERLEEKFPGFCPIELMCQIAQDPVQEYQLRLQAAKEIAQYIYPKLKSVEHKGEGMSTTIVIQEYREPTC